MAKENGRDIVTAKEEERANEKLKDMQEKVIHAPGGKTLIVDLKQRLVLDANREPIVDEHGERIHIMTDRDGSIRTVGGTILLTPQGLPVIGHGRDGLPLLGPGGQLLQSPEGRPLLGMNIARRLPQTTLTPTTAVTTTTIAMTTIATTTIAMSTFASTAVLMTTISPIFGIEDTEEGSGISTIEPEPEVTSLTFKPLPTEHVAMVGTPENMIIDPHNTRDVPIHYISKDPKVPCSLEDTLSHFRALSLKELVSPALSKAHEPPTNLTVMAAKGCHSFVILAWDYDGGKAEGYIVYMATLDDALLGRWKTGNVTNRHRPIENLQPSTRYYFRVRARSGLISEPVGMLTQHEATPHLIVRPPGGEPLWTTFQFRVASPPACRGQRLVKKTRYNLLIGVSLCSSLRYSLFLGKVLTGEFYPVADMTGNGEDHCQFVDSFMEGRVGPATRYRGGEATVYYRATRQQPVRFGPAPRGATTPSWIECGQSVPGVW